MMNRQIGRLAAGVAVAVAVSTMTGGAAAAEEVGQWATSATATSEYSARYLALAATGAPNAVGCDFGDSSVWASYDDNTVESITLGYSQAVVPSRIRVYQNNMKGSISRIDVSADGSTWTQVYTGNPATAVRGICATPDTTVFDDVLDVAVSNVASSVAHVRITVDQSQVRGWAEIDAVQLVTGHSSAGTTVARRTYGVVAGSSVLTKKSKSSLRRMVALAGTDAKYVVTGTASRISGVPTDHVRALAKSRATKVRKYLIHLGVARKSITIKTKVYREGVSPKLRLYVRYLATS